MYICTLIPQKMDDLKEIRWKQRFENYERAFILLESAIEEGTKMCQKL